MGTSVQQALLGQCLACGIRPKRPARRIDVGRFDNALAKHLAGADEDNDVDSAGIGFGGKFTYEGFALVAAGFHGTGLGIRGQRSQGDGPGTTHALDDVGKERKSYGGYIQGTYSFGQGTNVGYSYGGNFLKKTGNDLNNPGTMNHHIMHSGMIWHNVTDNFRLVAEGGYAEKAWYLADDEQEDSFGGVGAFFFW